MPTQPNLSQSSKTADALSADSGEVVTYTIALVNSGGAIQGTAIVSDTVPEGLDYLAGSLSATTGIVDDTTAPTLAWHGLIAEDSHVTITYQVQVNGTRPGGLVNHAIIQAPGVATLDLANALFVPRSVLTSTHTDLFFPGTQAGNLQDDQAVDSTMSLGKNQTVSLILEISEDSAIFLLEIALSLVLTDFAFQLWFPLLTA